MPFPLLAILPVVGKLIDKLLPDPAAAAKAQLDLMKLAQDGELAWLAADVQLAVGQMEINKEEAKDPSLFKSGWRPGVGWLCVAGFGYVTILRPLPGARVVRWHQPGVAAGSSRYSPAASSTASVIHASSPSFGS